jgi:hypothetical protein
MTNLKPEWEAELERLGVEGVRILLSKAQWSADDTVQLWPRTLDNPSRRDIEDWLKAKHDEGERRDASVARWTKIAAVAAIAATIVSLVAWLCPARPQHLAATVARRAAG